MDFKKNNDNTIEFKLTIPDQLLSKGEEASEKKTSVIVFDSNTEYGTGTSLIKAESKKKSSIQVPPLVEKILHSLNGNGRDDSVERLAFETNPINSTQYQSIYRAKLRGLPDYLLKRVAIQDDLIGAIDGVRCNQSFAFGRPRENRFKLGFEIKPIEGILDEQDVDRKELVQKRIAAAVKKFYHCGSEEGISLEERLTLPEFLYRTTHNAIILGRIAVEIIKDHEEKFHSFRPIDSGTIYKATNQKDAQDNLRRQALQVLKKLKNDRIDPRRFQSDEYAWIQVIDGVPVQAFTSDECYVQNFYPLLDIELDGYPATPIDRMIGAVTTHINIATHNKLYFQYGRASHGMLIIRSDTVNEQVVHRIKQQFNAAVNSVNASFRMPVFGIDPASEITYQSIDNANRDMEFQYLSDNNARSILSAFQMSPDELPGWSYLSRGTNSQALSESSNEWKLQASRDVGFRPLLQRFEDFLNSRIFPLIDEELSKLCIFRFVGLDADNQDQEIIHLQQNSQLHLTYNEILTKVEKKELPKELGADFPLNPQYQAILDKYLTVGEIKEYFLGIKGASKNPTYDYVRDPFYFQQQMRLDQQAMISTNPQVTPPLPPNAEPLQPQEETLGAESQSTYNPPTTLPTEELEPSNTSVDPYDFHKAVDQAKFALTKAEKQLSPSKRRVLDAQKKLLQSFVDSWKVDLHQATEQIHKVAHRFLPKTN